MKKDGSSTPNHDGRTLADDIAALRELSKPTISKEEAASYQNWVALDGATAFHLIERHAANWADVGLLMEAWLSARTAQSESGWSDAYKDAIALNLKLRKALEQCVRVCREWHAMPGKPGPGDAFDIYFNHSPEMKLIRDALGKMPDPTEDA